MRKKQVWGAEPRKELVGVLFGGFATKQHPNKRDFYKETHQPMLAQALTGIHVIEVAAYIPGPACTQILVGMGARVTKVERPGGDPMRVMPPLDAGGESPQFRVLNRGKEHPAPDLKVG